MQHSVLLTSRTSTLNVGSPQSFPNKTEYFQQETHLPPCCNHTQAQLPRLAFTSLVGIYVLGPERSSCVSNVFAFVLAQKPYIYFKASNHEDTICCCVLCFIGCMPMHCL